MSLLDRIPELPLIAAAVLAVLLVSAIRRTVAWIVLAVVVLLVGSAVLHWPPPDLSATCLPAAPTTRAIDTASR